MRHPVSHLNHKPQNIVQVSASFSSRFDFCHNCSSAKSDCANRISIPDSKNKPSSDKAVSYYCAETTAKQSGLAHCVVMWWMLDMDTNGEITLTTAPRWTHPEGVNIQVLYWSVFTHFVCIAGESSKGGQFFVIS